MAFDLEYIVAGVGCRYESFRVGNEITEKYSIRTFGFPRPMNGSVDVRVECDDCGVTLVVRSRSRFAVLKRCLLAAATLAVAALLVVLRVSDILQPGENTAFFMNIFIFFGGLGGLFFTFGNEVTTGAGLNIVHDPGPREHKLFKSESSERGLEGHFIKLDMKK